MTRRTAARPAQGSDHGTPERRQHAASDAIVEETAEATVSGQVIARRVRIRPPIECMGLPDEQVAAAHRFRDDYETAVWRVHDSGREDGQRIRSNVPPTTMPDAVLDAMARYAKAIAALGPCAHAVIAVVGEGYTLTEAAKRMRRNRQELAGVLKAGLEALVKLERREG